jgi:hypothetical protein
MAAIFVSYRADDSVHLTSRLAEDLAAHFGNRQVFRDHDSMALGTVYPERIHRALQECGTMIAVIGPHWLDARDRNGLRRIDNPRDWVRVELRTAFQRGIPVIPVLLDGTHLPTREQLPTDIGLLSRSHYWQIRSQIVRADIRGLIEKLDPDARHSEQPRGTENPPGVWNTQQNTATSGGTVIANQGTSATQNVTIDRRNQT